MKVEQEVHAQSEDISDAVMADVIKALKRRVRTVDRRHDIPYIAGYSVDGKTIFIDRHLPRSFTYWTRRVYVDQFILTHEIVEKALLDELRLHYLHAHQIALRTERAAVESAGISWRAYNRFTKTYEKPIQMERLQHVPRSLDLTPYRDEEDFSLLKRLVAKEGK